MRHTRYRQLDRQTARQLDHLIIGANPEKLEHSKERVDITVPVEWPGRGRWQASSAQVQGLIKKLNELGGHLEAQRTNGDWQRIYQYKTVKGTRYGCAASTGKWFAVQALREVR